MSFDFKSYCKGCYDDGKTTRKQIKIKDQYPAGIERSLNKVLREEMLKITEQIRDLVQSELNRMPRTDSLDRTDGYIDQLNNFFDSLANSVKVPKGYKSWYKQFAEDIEKWNTKKFTEGVNKELGVDFYLPQTEFSKELVSGWVTSNDKVLDRYLVDTVEKLREQITRDYMSGLRATEIESKLLDPIAGGNTINLTNEQVVKKAKLWARNEVGNLNTNLTKTRQNDLGIDKSMWSTSGDERVRCQHRAYDGKMYPTKTGITREWLQENNIAVTCSGQVNVKQKNGTFETKNVTGDRGKEIDYYGGAIWAGTPINCRCTAISVIDLDDIEDYQAIAKTE